MDGKANLGGPCFSTSANLEGSEGAGVTLSETNQEHVDFCARRLNTGHLEHHVPEATTSTSSLMQMYKHVRR